MRLVFVHGIKHEGKSSDWIKSEWIDALCRNLSEEDAALLRRQPVDAPFYGDALHALTQEQEKGEAKLSAQSAAASASDEADFYSDALAEVAASQAQTLATPILTEEAEMVAMGLNPHNRHLLAIVRALESVSPLKGDAVLRLLPQAFTYLRRLHATVVVDDIVRPELEKGPCIVVAHSLGTVISFKLLRDLRQSVPLLITMGSPLAIKAVQKPVGTPYGKRAETNAWLNVYDRDDFVTLGKPLSGNFGSGMTDVAVDNSGEDAHSHEAYLTQSAVAQALIEAIKTNG